MRILGAGARVLAAATSGWLVVKLASKRPARPAPEIAELGARTPPRVIADPFDDLPDAVAAGPAGGDGRVPFVAGRYDLDLNAHANNVAIVRWLLEAAPEAAVVPPLDLEVDFRGEVLAGDLLRPCGRTSDGAFVVSLVRAADGREVARGRITGNQP